MQTRTKIIFFLGALAIASLVLRFRSPADFAGKTSVLPPPDTAEANKAPSPAAVTTPASAGTADKAVEDDFELVANSAKKALVGDGKAALTVADVLSKCLPTKYQYRNMADPRAAFESEFEGKNLPLWVLDRMRARFNSCNGFIHGDPFAGLPDRPNGYESLRYWNDLAYQQNDPVALVQHAAAQKGLITGAADRPSIEAAQADLDKSAITGDPEALFRIGMLLADGRVGQDTLNGFATMIAACNMGYDCTANNEFAFGACVAANACQQGEIYTDKIRTTIGDGNYAKAFGLAQQLQDALTRGDTKTVVQFVQLKGAPSVGSR
jgi:hypothetical protein